MSDSDPSRSQLAWNRMADRLKEVGEKITGATGARNGRERAEGYRYLTRLLAAGHELEMEVDRRHPNLARMMTPIRKFIGDGTDVLYHEAKLDENLVYVLSLRRGEDLFYSATVYAYDEQAAYYIVDHLIDEEIEWDDVFGEAVAHLYLSAERPDGVANWVQLKGRDPILCTRQYFPEFVDAVDAGSYRPAVQNIFCLSDVDDPAPYSEADLEAGLDRLVDFVDRTSDVAIGISIFAGLNLVEFEPETGGAGHAATHISDGEIDHGGERSDGHTPQELARMIDPKLVRNNLPGPGIQYIGAWYELAGDEAILIEGSDIPCRYWSCQILTRYLESGDYRFHKVGLNDRQVQLAEDGSFKIYACAEDPGVENWVSTQGYTSSHILIRTLLAEDKMEASFRVIKLKDIEPGG